MGEACDIDRIELSIDTPRRERMTRLKRNRKAVLTESSDQPFQHSSISILLLLNDLVRVVAARCLLLLLLLLLLLNDIEKTPQFHSRAPRHKAHIQNSTSRCLMVYSLSMFCTEPYGKERVWSNESHAVLILKRLCTRKAACRPCTAAVNVNQLESSGHAVTHAARAASASHSEASLV